MHTAPKATGFALLLLLGSCGALLGGYIWLTSGESFVEVYATRSDALDAIRRGWIPASLPESARSIRSYGDLDVNYSFGSFEMREADRAEFEKQLLAVPGFAKFRVDGEAACAPRTGAPSQQEGFELYREKGADGYLIASKEGCVLFSNGL